MIEVGDTVRHKFQHKIYKVISVRFCEWNKEYYLTLFDGQMDNEYYAKDFELLYREVDNSELHLWLSAS
jgi:hypothetical protein